MKDDAHPQTDAAEPARISQEPLHVGLFETPLVIIPLQDSAQMISDLAAAIRARKAEHPGVQRSNVGGWHSDAGMPQWGGPAARRLAELTIQHVRGITHLEGHGWEQVSWSMHMWANVSGPGSANALHIHPGNLWAAVFYVDLGDGDGTQDVGGQIYFQDPRYPGAYMHATAFRPLGLDGQPMHWERQIRPRAGDLIFFPSWLSHGVRPYRGDSERISIAMNLEPVISGATRR